MDNCKEKIDLGHYWDPLGLKRTKDTHTQDEKLDENWTRSVQDLNTFTSFLHDIHPTIKLTCDHSFKSLPFLDVNVSLRNGKIVTDLYTKPTDKHQYLLHSSCHPIHTKRAIPFRICSTNETFTLRTNELIDYIHKRGYNRYFLQREIQRVNNITRTEGVYLFGLSFCRGSRVEGSMSRSRVL